MGIVVKRTDLIYSKEKEDFLEVLQSYAKDVMGGGKEIGPNITSKLINNLVNVPNKLLLLAYKDNDIAGLANCFYGFSTFKAQPLINIHDFAVLPKYRGQGVGLEILKRVEQIAKDEDCCKITLEVLEGNKRAQSIYQEFGFEGYELDPEMGKAIFLEKLLV